MENDLQVKVMRCPTCGDKLKYSTVGETVVCMSCGNTVKICKDAINEKSIAKGENTTAVMKIEGIKTSSSTLAFVEQFLDDYDWDAFAFDTEFTIDELDNVVDNLKVTSADDKKTWITALTCLVVPFSKKIEYSDKALEEIIKEYKNNNLDSYGMYDAYKKVIMSIVKEYPTFKEKALKMIEYAKKYGAMKEEIESLNEMLNKIDIATIQKTIFNSIEEIPAIKDYENEKQNEIVKQLQECNIDAEVVYQQALMDVDGKKYKEALDGLLSIYGYKDTEKRINELERSIRFSDVISVKNNLYYLSKKSEEKSYDLHEIKNTKISEKKLICQIAQIVAVYANSIYYFKDDAGLYCYCFDTNKDIKIGDNFFTKTFYFSLRLQALFLIKTNKKASDGNHFDFVKVNLKNNTVETCVKGLVNVLKFENSEHLSYRYEKEIDKEIKTITAVYVVSENKSYDVTQDFVFVCGYSNNNVIYTLKAPNYYNKNLYSKELIDESMPILLEANISGDCKIVDGNIYYYTIDNLDKKYLITIDANGENRKELAPFIKEILFISGDWIYFIKAYRYNTALCKVKKDGSKTSIIASQIAEFIEIKAGYLYYFDDERDLRKVRMDGSKNKVISHLVKKVLSIKDDKVIYIADDKIIENTSYDADGSEMEKEVYNKSIYAMDFSEVGRRKACYNIIDGKCFDNNTIYYTKNKKVESENEEKIGLFLYSLDIDTYETRELVELKAPEKAGCYIATSVYGSYDCPEVWTLRRYRDYKLAKTWLGRAFIRTYYATSPTLVKFFGKTKWFKSMWQRKLNKMVNKLQKEGFANTPYDDMNW